MKRRGIVWMGLTLIIGLMAAGLLQTAWAGGELENPAIYADRYPLQYASYQKNTLMEATAFSGSVPFSRLERYPWLKDLYAGYGFAEEYNEDRGHVYSLADAWNITRKKPGAACWTCKSTNVPSLLDRYGEGFYAKPFDSLKAEMKYAIGCSDCHDPATWKLRLTRPALVDALRRRGEDTDNLPVARLRTLVCAQCHVEYYFKPQTQAVTFPWDKGLTPTAVDDYYAELDFADWTHQVSGAPMIKIQHPDYEFSQGGFHQKIGLSCADCHMPRMKTEDGRSYTSHWWTSPLKHVGESCRRCHSSGLDRLPARVEALQSGLQERLAKAAQLTVQGHQAIAASVRQGASAGRLTEARILVRKAQIRVDWLAAESSAGFHNPQAARSILAEAETLAQQAVAATP